MNEPESLIDLTLNDAFDAWARERESRHRDSDIGGGS